ncbi:hypothetical protein PEC18_18860 [Paucibacter sp. O1-1]|nr:hypothetical protein [Paucibacter sp. O1-1]MDA3827859.1 hypothetical protein [Paucibacter sp. O1-1]
MLFEFDKTSFAIVFAQTYDVFGPAGIASPDGIFRSSSDMAADLNYIAANRPGNYIVVRGYDEPRNNRFDNGLATAMYRCGASPAKFGSPNFPFRAAYILIGRAGIGQGGGVEFLSEVGDAAGAWADLTMTWAKGALTVTGAGAPRSIGDYGYTGDLNASATVSLIGRTGIDVKGSTLTKVVSAGTDWIGDAYSRDSYAGPCYCSFVATATNTHLMAGLNTDPTTNESYTSLDTSWYLAGGHARIYESGSDVSGDLGAYAVGDVFSITHDGVNARYYRNGTLYRTVPWGTTAPVFFDSSFYTPGGSISNVQFGPLSSSQWSAVGGAGKPQDNATNGATIGANLFGSFTQATWDVVMSSAYIKRAHIDTGSFVNLAALTAWTGTLTVDAGGYLRGGQTDWATGDGFFLGWSSGAYKLSIGNALAYLRWSPANGLELKLDAFTASISGGSLSGSVGNGDRIYGSRTVSVTNGTAPYTYNWALVGVAGEAPDVPVSMYVSSGIGTATATISGSSTNNQVHAYAQCTVVDVNGRSASAGFNVLITHGTYIP